MDLPPGTWLALTGAVLTSSVLSALVTSGVQWYRDHRKEEREGETLAAVEAAKLIGVLEQYALGIALQVKWNNEAFHQFDEEKAAKSQNLALPDPPPLPHGLLLKHLPKDVAADIIWIETETFLSRMHMGDVWDEAWFRQEGVKQLHELLGFFGYKAIEAADRLREKLDLPAMVNPLFDDHRYTLYALNKEYLGRIQIGIDSRTGEI
ncbi:hypothetical protein [Pseudomonas sp. GM_Psu_2]|uniref:hypothetical protein n=1 Tax=unclassified Pseudomonas TaxID=196821 RepID=UPI00226A44C7|nr:hypothetical protein [Pseudomonas sp. GM_Psu_2]